MPDLEFVSAILAEHSFEEVIDFAALQQILKKQFLAQEIIFHNF